MCVGCVCTFWRECKLTPSCERMCPPLPLQELYLQKMPNQESMEQAKLWKIERLNYKTAWYIVEGLKMSHSSQNSWNVLEVLETWWSGVNFHGALFPALFLGRGSRVDA